MSQVIESNAQSEKLPTGTSWLVAESDNIKVYTYMSPYPMFANTSHVIELNEELIIIDGQFFAPYAQELESFVAGLGKPVSRFYISHGHPDHYIGFGDAFPDAVVYALAETKALIEKEGQATLVQRQAQFGPLIAKSLNLPTMVQKPGKEKIGNVKFIFEKAENNEFETSLIVKIPELGINIVQDIVYNGVHLFIEGDLNGWETALSKLLSEKNDYPRILGGHGKEGGTELIEANLSYLSFVRDNIKNTSSAEEFKTKLMEAYPDYAGEQLVDIYLAYYLKPDNWK